jgi:hypothetical protein
LSVLRFKVKISKNLSNVMIFHLPGFAIFWGNTK